MKNRQPQAQQKETKIIGQIKRPLEIVAKSDNTGILLNYSY